MLLDIHNLQENIDVEPIDNWVQQMESYYSVNQLSEAEMIAIASLKMLTFVHCWWDNLSKNMETYGDPIDTWDKFVDNV